MKIKNKKEFEEIKSIIEDINLNESNKLYLIEILAEKIYFPENFSYYNGANSYMDKFKYLFSAKISIQYRIYPLYIDNEEDLYIKENKKRIFRFSCSNYVLDNDYHLYFTKLKKEIKNKNEKTSIKKF